MRQKAFDPFAEAERARDEEFGDCLAEGLYWLLDGRLPLERADVLTGPAFWRVGVIHRPVDPARASNHS